MKIEVNGIKLFYKIIGKGMPLVFLHGGLGMDHSYFLPFVESLSKNFQLIFFDFRGNGRSDAASLETYTHETFVEDTKKLIEKLGLEWVCFLGHSHGGYIALEFVLKYPNLVKKLILTDSHPGEKRKLPPKSYKSDEDFKREVIKNLSKSFQPKNKEEGKKALEKVIYRKDVFEKVHRDEMPKYDVREKLSQIKTPTLIILAEHDPERFQKGSKILNQRILNSKLIIIKDSGHFPFIEKTKEFNKIVERFLKE